MSYRVEQFAATIPANTPKSALHTVTLGLENWQVDQIDLEVPPGPSGLMGFYVANNGVQWIPFTAGTYLVWDDARESWPLTDQPTGKGWQIVGYNEDSYEHTVTVRFHVSEVPPPRPPSPVLPFRFVTEPAVEVQVKAA